MNICWPFLPPEAPPPTTCRTFLLNHRRPLPTSFATETLTILQCTLIRALAVQMMLLGKSQSAHGRRSNKSDTHASEREPAAIRHRPSFDTFVIQRRTRYPSNQVGPPQPTNLDIQVTASLLGHHIDASGMQSLSICE